MLQTKRRTALLSPYRSLARVQKIRERLQDDAVEVPARNESPITLQRELGAQSPIRTEPDYYELARFSKAIAHAARERAKALTEADSVRNAERIREMYRTALRADAESTKYLSLAED